MKKLTLDLDTLAVESFDTEVSEAGQGTVHAHDSDGGTLYDFSCGRSCYAGCTGYCTYRTGCCHPPTE